MFSHWSAKKMSICFQGQRHQPRELPAYLSIGASNYQLIWFSTCFVKNYDKYRQSEVFNVVTVDCCPVWWSQVCSVEWSLLRWTSWNNITCLWYLGQMWAFCVDSCVHLFCFGPLCVILKAPFVPISDKLLKQKSMINPLVRFEFL